jgi:hypothetical protein
MQLLLQHQTQQMQALRQQQQWDAYPASSSSSMQETGRSAAYVGLSAQQAGSFNGGSPLLSRNASFNRCVRVCVCATHVRQGVSALVTVLLLRCRSAPPLDAHC